MELVSQVIACVESPHRSLPLDHSSYYSYRHEQKVGPNRQPAALDLHMAAFITDYINHEANVDWRRMNDSTVADAANAACNQVGTESWFINGTETVIGKVMHTALLAELVRLESGIDNGLPSGTARIPSMLPHHKEGTSACTPHVHVRLPEYCSLDNSISGLIMALIAPVEKDGMPTCRKPSFYFYRAIQPAREQVFEHVSRTCRSYSGAWVNGVYRKGYLGA